jgi:hypothetical protein
MQPNDPLSIPETHLPAWVGYSVLVGSALYILLCYFIAATKGRRSDLGHMDTFILCLVASPLVGYLLAHSQMSRGGHTCNWCGKPNVVTKWCPCCGKDQQGNDIAGHHPSTR